MTLGWKSPHLEVQNEITQIHTGRSSENFLQTSHQNQQFRTLDTESTESKDQNK